jgi:hypothetical protein
MVSFFKIWSKKYIYAKKKKNGELHGKKYLNQYILFKFVSEA